MKSFKSLAGPLDLTRSRMTPLFLQTVVTQVASLLNSTPLGVSIKNSASPTLNIFTPNQFMAFNHHKQNQIGSISVAGILQGLDNHAEAMYNIYTTIVLPSLLPPARWADHRKIEKLETGDVDLFSNQGKKLSFLADLLG